METIGIKVVLYTYRRGVQCVARFDKQGNSQASEDAILSLSGLNLDAVWESIVRSIGQIEIESGNTLTEQIITNDQRVKLLAQITTLERKMASEKQPRRKREYFEQIKKLKNQI